MSHAAGSASGYEREPNDVNPNALFSGEKMHGHISSIEDIDWFYLDASSTSSLLVEFDSPTQSNLIDYFEVWVFDNEGNLLSSRSTGESLEFEVNAQSTEYYVAITASNLFDGGEYVLTVSEFSTTRNLELEPNDSDDFANEMDFGSSIFGQLSTRDDSDIFVSV